MDAMIFIDKSLLFRVISLTFFLFIILWQLQQTFNSPCSSRPVISNGMGELCNSKLEKTQQNSPGRIVTQRSNRHSTDVSHFHVNAKAAFFSLSCYFAHIWRMGSASTGFLSVRLRLLRSLSAILATIIQHRRVKLINSQWMFNLVSFIAIFPFLEFCVCVCVSDMVLCDMVSFVQA